MTTYLLNNQQKGGDNVELLNLIHYGKENAISREDLSKLTGWDDRKVREEIKRLMRNGERILSSSSARAIGEAMIQTKSRDSLKRAITAAQQRL